MDTVAQGSTWSDVTTPILSVSGSIVTNGLSGTPTVTLTTLRDSADADRRTGATLTYAGDGAYRITKPIPSDGALGSWFGVITYDDGAGFVRTYPFGFTVVTPAQADPAGALSGAVVVTGSPVAATGESTIYRGDAYASADSRQLPWTITNASSYPDLTGATITLYATNTANKSAHFTASGSVVTPTGSTRAVLVQLTSEQTIALLDGEYAYSVVAVPTTGRPLTLAAGTLTVHPGGRPPARR